MAPGEFREGCKFLAEAFVTGMTLLTNAIWSGIQQDREWHAQLDAKRQAEDDAHQARMQAINQDHADRMTKIRMIGSTGDQRVEG